MTREWEPLAPACAGCREVVSCFPGPCKIYQARRSALAAAARQGGDVKQAPAESPQSGPAQQGNAPTQSIRKSHQ